MPGKTTCSAALGEKGTADATTNFGKLVAQLPQGGTWGVRLGDQDQQKPVR